MPPQYYKYITVFKVQINNENQFDQETLRFKSRSCNILFETERSILHQLDISTARLCPNYQPYGTCCSNDGLALRGKQP